MAVYTVLIPPAPPGEAPSPERIVFLRDGFSTPAFLFGPLWLLWRRAWLPAVLWTAALALIFGAGVAFGIDPEAASVLQLALGALLGLEGPRLVAWSLERKGYTESAVMVADNIDEAEDVFFANWRPSGVVKTTVPTTTGGRAAMRPIIGGLFEEPRA
ncbi:DUF2628 domain-containing protein [Methylosinus sp. H3A]|uniref:DUF2628 domain-containing protein n=1 Tax=Methylosinus sp. H3A TaxID=2785786 RepID=UPI0018C1D446|nr:DUF2628 domain-containing protein [Methylosinus sp. H3A]MBG0808312.1 DUF2628 domain-containing protein [Methylosinus sp. H3A]